MKTLQKTRANWFSFAKRNDQISFMVGLSVIVDQLMLAIKPDAKINDVWYSLSPHTRTRETHVSSVHISRGLGNRNSNLIASHVVMKCTKLPFVEIFLRALAISGLEKAYSPTTFTRAYTTIHNSFRWRNKFIIGLDGGVPLDAVTYVSTQAAYVSMRVPMWGYGYVPTNINCPPLTVRVIDATETEQCTQLSGKSWLTIAWSMV